MRYILTIFTVFLMLFAPFVGANEAENSESGIANAMVGIMQGFQNEITQAENRPDSDYDFVNKPENLDFFTLLSLPTKQAGILTGQRGLSDWVEVKNVGMFRLVSCYGGMHETKNPQFLSMQAIINEGVVLKKPLFHNIQVENGQNQHIFYPVQDVYAKNNEAYQSYVFFPIFYEIIDKNKAFTLDLLVDIEGCNNQQCTTKTIPLSLSLDNTTRFQTDVCTAMNRQLRATPLPNRNQVGARAYLLNENQVQLVLDFKRDIDFIHLQINTINNWQIVKKQIIDDKADIMISFTDSIQDIKALDMNILSSAGFFNEVVPITSKMPVIVRPDLSFWLMIKTGVLLFLLSPFFILFFSQGTYNKKDFIKIIAYTLSLGLVIALLLYFNVINPDVFNVSSPFAVACVVVLALLLYQPVIDMGLLIPLFILMPKPYLSEFLAQLAPYSIKSGVFIMLMLGISVLPFYVARNWGVFFTSLSLAEKPVNNIKRIPIFILLLWAGLIVILPFINKVPPLKNENQIHRLIEQGDFVMLTMENKASLSHLLNQFSLKYMAPAKNAYKKGKIKLFTVSSRSPIGKTVQKKLNISSISTQIIYGPHRPYGSQINTYLSPIDWSVFINTASDVLKK